jgi:histidine triad (HIT) family protein
MEDCLFCKIVKGEIPSSKVYEDERVLAFDDISPAAPVHVIVIPKEHIPTYMDVRAGQMEHITAMTTAVQSIARIKGIDESGFRTVVNCNKDGGQIIFHLHMHVLGGKKLEERMA